MNAHASPAQRTYPCVESTDDFVSGEHRVRIWRNEDPAALLPRYDNEDIRSFVDANHHLPMHKLAEAIARLPRINAVHVLHHFGGPGIVIYVNWP